MTGSRTRPAILIAGLLLGLLAVTLQGVQGEELEKVPSEDQCRPYIEKALKDLGTEGHEEDETAINDVGVQGDEAASDADDNVDTSGSREKREVSSNEVEGDSGDDKTNENENEVDQDQVETVEITSVEDEKQEADASAQESDDQADSAATAAAADSVENDDQSKEASGDESQEKGDNDKSAETVETTDDETVEDKTADSSEVKAEEEVVVAEEESNEPQEDASDETKSVEDDVKSQEEEVKDDADSKEEVKEPEVDSKEEETKGDDANSVESLEDVKEADSKEEDKKESVKEEQVVAETAESMEDEQPQSDAPIEDTQEAEDEAKSTEVNVEDAGESKEAEPEKSVEADAESKEEKVEGSDEGSEEARPEEEELIMEIEIPEVLRPRDHINQLLKLDQENEVREQAVEKVADVVLRDLKRLYDNAIKPLETLYKYRDLSNRHFGDPEIFSKPLVLFMGPWSGGKSSIINYLLDLEYKTTSLRTGAEPSPAYFNILMHGEEEEILDGTQLAADWTFSGLQKFGQGLLDRLKGYKLKNKLLEKVNIVEIPGILEVRKQVQRLFPFNDACQWFIDRADIIFLVYDPSKLDVGPETEAVLDQLKGREYQTRIILNKADQVKPEELMRVQGALIWNISPLMSSAEPPVMYSTSLWSIPYEAGAPTRLLYAQERAFLRDLRSAIDKRVEHKIASARRFAVRVRNHAKMVDCYLTTYYNHKSFFAKKKDISDRIIENPQDYHIYEGLSTLTNISRYDLPDPDVYRDFFRLNPLYEFPLLSSTCTYFRGCPINRLDVVIAYDLPELVGKYKKSVEAALHSQEEEEITAAPPTAAPVPAATSQAQKTAAKSSASRITMS